jgi:bifunctional UDP-N-acetylglucosamine pyrophosphorylase/glucosamine-1-phosphate N-acetyltransferase
LANKPKKTAKKTATKRPLAAVILAAGEGKRMRSRKAKVLHEIAGKSLVSHVIDAVAKLSPERTIVVVGHQADQVRRQVGEGIVCVMQKQQLGTGHAVLQAKKALAGFDGDVLVLCGDVPLMTTQMVRRLTSLHRRSDAQATVLGMIVESPEGYGRILQQGKGRIRIVEHADASADERIVDEVNTGTYCFDSKFLFSALGRLGKNNAQGEYYLTDVLDAASANARAQTLTLDDETEGMGVNSRGDLAQAEAIFQERLINSWMDRGVTFLDPATAYLGADVRIGSDTTIGPNVRLEGTTVIGSDCVFDGMDYLSNTKVADNVHLRWGVVGNDARVGKGAILGPYAHLRPQADLGPNVHIGNFVEVKKSKIGAGSKANHLAYIGDSTIGKDSNIGAGTITCNYDGFAKHRTVIGDRVQIGSDSQLVAPVTLGNDVFVAAGSTVTTDVPAGSLVFNDKRQKVRGGWVAAFRKRAARRKR